MVVDLVHIGRNKDIAKGFIQPDGQADIGVRKGRGEDQDGLKDHDGIHGGAADEDAHEEEQSAQYTFARVVTESGGDIHIIIGMVNDMEAPEKRYFMFGDMDQPAAKEIEHQKGDQHGGKHAGIEPMHQSKRLVTTPITNENNDEGEKSVNDEVNDSKTKIDQRVSRLGSFICHGQERNGPFNDPEKKQTAYENGHAFQRALFQRREVVNDVFPHDSNFGVKLRGFGSFFIFMWHSFAPGG